MAIDEKAIRTLLGIDDDTDPADKIREIQATVIAQDAVIKTDAKGETKKELAAARASATEAQGRALTLQAELDQRLSKVENERAKEKAEAKVDLLVARGRIKPVDRDMTLDFALSLSEEKFDAFIKALPSIDMSERGVATGHELADLEPTPAEIAVAKQMGPYDEAKRAQLIKTKAAERGLTLPEVK